MSKEIKGILNFNLKKQSGLCGQAFTNYKCISCGSEECHPNTCTPIICPKCVLGLKNTIKQNEIMQEALDEILNTKDFKPEASQWVVFNTRYLRWLSREALKKVKELENE